MEESELLKICVGSFIFGLNQTEKLQYRYYTLKNCYNVLLPTLHSRIKIT